MAEDRSEIIRAIRDVQLATETHAAALLAENEERKVGLARIEAGDAIRDVVSSAPIGPHRQRVKESRDVLDAARVHMRSVLMRACVDDGMTNREIAEIWGITVQLVSRYTRNRSRRSDHR